MSNFIDFNPATPGQTQSAPSIWSCSTTDSLAVVTATGYLNDKYSNGLGPLGAGDVLIINYGIGGTTGTVQGYAKLVSDNMDFLIGLPGGSSGTAYQGTWNASTNTPTLPSTPALGSAGQYYLVSVAGTQFSIQWAVGDWIISNGTAWQKIDNQNTVTSVFGRTGAVVAVSGDYTVAQVTGAAPLASPTFTGVPAGPTASPGTSTTQLATTAFVATSFAPLASPTFTGVPTAPTAAPGTNTTQVATTGFVTAAVAAGPVTSVFSRTGAVTAQTGDYTVSEVTGAAPLASPTFTGTPAAPTPTPGDSTTKIATTAFVATSFAPLANPTFTGTVTVPTPTPGDSTTKAASTEFVATSFAPLAAPSFTGAVTLSGNLDLNTPGQKLNIGTGSNSIIGTLVLNGSTPVVVSTTSVTGSSLIFLSRTTLGGTPLMYSVTNITAGVSFEVTGAAGDTSTLAYLIIN